ncbi:MAG: hypothetical protein F4X64_10345 [Chloroflexi bacterium]|nr:hypothetical protein [Chloroflexota bacterium]
MIAQEHLIVARQFWELAHNLNQQGHVTAAGELLWGAVNRIILAINLRHGIIPPSRPLRRNTIIRYLDAQHQTTPDLEDGMSAVGDLHGHFYNSNLTQSEIERRTGNANVFIAALFNLPGTHVITQA